MRTGLRRRGMVRACCAPRQGGHQCAENCRQPSGSTSAGARVITPLSQRHSLQGAVRGSARRTYSATTLPFSASLAATFSPALFSSVAVATSNAIFSCGVREGGVSPEGIPQVTGVPFQFYRLYMQSLVTFSNIASRNRKSPCDRHARLYFTDYSTWYRRPVLPGSDPPPPGSEQAMVRVSTSTKASTPQLKSSSIMP